MQIVVYYNIVVSPNLLSYFLHYSPVPLETWLLWTVNRRPSKSMRLKGHSERLSCVTFWVRHICLCKFLRSKCKIMWHHKSQWTLKSLIHVLFTIFIHTKRSICSVIIYKFVRFAFFFFTGSRSEFKRPSLSVALSEMYKLVTNVRLSSFILVAER
jgi:hypothetical protein